VQCVNEQNEGAEGLRTQDLMNLRPIGGKRGEGLYQDQGWATSPKLMGWKCGIELTGKRGSGRRGILRGAMIGGLFHRKKRKLAAFKNKKKK